MGATQKVLGVLGGAAIESNRLVEWAAAADIIYAADSGCDACLAVGVRPVVVGDLDSAKSDLTGLRVVHLPDQATTDCDKLLDIVHQEAPQADLVLTGLEGDRLDHVMASLDSIARSPHSPRIVLHQGIGHVLRAPGEYTFQAQSGTTVSLMPVRSLQAGMTGVAWPFESRTIELGTFVSVSNIVRDRLTVTLEQGIGLLVVNDHHKPW